MGPAAGLAVAVVGWTFAFATGPWLFAGVFAAGALVSGLFPLAIAWGMDAAPEHSGPVNAVGMFAAQVGFLTAPAAVGVLAERVGIRTAIHALTALAAAYLVVVAANRAAAG